jgi:hypothetical protein
MPCLLQNYCDNIIDQAQAAMDGHMLAQSGQLIAATWPTAD